MSNDKPDMRAAQCQADFEEYSKRHADGMGVSDCVGYDYGNAWRQGHARSSEETTKLMREKDAHRDHLLEKLAAAQAEVDRLNALDPAVIAYDTRSVRALTNLIKERDDLREQLAAAELRAAEYEKVLEDTIYDSERLEQGQYAVDKVKAVLAKHRRGGEGE